MFITSILLINEYPDLTADLLASKKNLGVVLGAKRLPWGVTILNLLGYVTTIFGVAYNIFPKLFLLSLFTTPLAIYETFIVFRMAQNRELIYQACINNLKLYACFGLTFIIANIVGA